jgi:hypothetical protein
MSRERKPPRLAHEWTPAQIDLLVPAGVAGSSLEVIVDAPLLESVRVEQVKPQPFRHARGAEWWRHLALREVHVVAIHGALRTRFSQVGPRHSQLVVEGEPLRLRQFVYP